MRPKPVVVRKAFVWPNKGCLYKVSPVRLDYTHGYSPGEYQTISATLIVYKWWVNFYHGDHLLGSGHQTVVMTHLFGHRIKIVCHRIGRLLVKLLPV